ncbi:ABC transporter substrate-binding protein [Microbacterium karelineae]|uniref:ABC transporter substrate-binding protein n=1 Tax=Microbacterium karelineae TaxID=2654283 RepID=UPI0012E9D6DD|nr:sugar ABC transporter substrate-binding protein [Microbacterium karelineae]
MKNTRKSLIGLALVGTAGLVLAGCSSDGGGAGGEVTIEFAQWWEPELPSGELRALVDEFEEANPGITVELLSGPYSSTREQLFAGAASGTMSDVVGLDGAWVNDFARQGAIADLSDLMSSAGYDDSQLASQVQVDGSTYMIPAANFVYPLYTNDDLLAGAGVDAPPTDRTEFADAARAITESGDAYGTAMPLSLESPSGVQNQVMSWVWASGGSMLADGQPDLTNDEVTSAIEYFDELYQDGVFAPGAFTMREQDMVEEFTNGRVGMMVDSLAHLTLIREANPDLSFSISALPAEDGYEGERGIPYASWGVGVSESSEHKDEAWALVEFLMSEDGNAKLSSMAGAFPGNVDAEPDFIDDDPIYQEAFDIYQQGYPANEFTGLPVAEELMRQFDTEFQRMLDGDIAVDEMLQTVQDSWMQEF